MVSNVVCIGQVMYKTRWINRKICEFLLFSNSNRKVKKSTHSIRCSVQEKVKETKRCRKRIVKSNLAKWTRWSRSYKHEFVLLLLFFYGPAALVQVQQPDWIYSFVCAVWKIEIDAMNACLELTERKIEIQSAVKIHFAHRFIVFQFFSIFDLKSSSWMDFKIAEQLATHGRQTKCTKNEQQIKSNEEWGATERHRR